MSERFEIIRRGYAHTYKDIAPYITYLESLLKLADEMAAKLGAMTVKCNHKPEGWDELEKAFKAYREVRKG